MTSPQLIDRIYQARMWARSQAWPTDYTYVLSLAQADAMAAHICHQWSGVPGWVGIQGKDLDGGDIHGAKIAVV